MPSNQPARQPQVSLAEPGAAITADAVVVLVVNDASGPRPGPGSAPVDSALGGRLTAALTACGASGRPDEVTRIPTLDRAPFGLVIATGVGPDPADTEQVRRAVGAALRVAGARHPRVHVAVDAPVGAVVEGALLGHYGFTAYKTGASTPRLRRLTVAASSTPDNRAALRRAKVVAEAVARVRDLVNTPPNDLYPETFAARAKDLADGAGLTVEVLDPAALRRGRYGGILAVGSGSGRPPRMVRVTYRPARPRARVALVGKGVTFDAGGLNLKTANLTWMKSDMGGGAAVLSVAVAAAELKLPIEVVATVPMAENMPSGTAYRPSDVLTLRGGRTVEVADTDAEGRLILADAITRAIEDEPDLLIEVSTLTGAQLVALGPRLIGAMGSEELRDQVVAAGARAGEGLWPMPLPDELRAGLESPVADLANIAPDRWGGMLVGGRFLAEFVPDGLPWVHLDIAGPAFNTAGARDYTPKGATGAAVRTLIATLEAIAAG